MCRVPQSPFLVVVHVIVVTQPHPQVAVVVMVGALCTKHSDWREALILLSG